MLAALVALCAGMAQAEAANPIRIASQSNPQTVVSEQDVAITIRIFNSSQSDITGEIRLYGPDGHQVDMYDGLAGEQSVTYTGTWHVTQDQIDEGRIKYYVRYSVDADSESITNTVPVAIQAEAAAPQLSATYNVAPNAAREGQQVTLTYTLSNTGNVELRNIAISNEGVTQEKITVASLSVGEKITRESTVTMGKEALVSNPTVTYEAADSGVTLTISDMARRTVAVAEEGLDVSIAGDGLDNVYPGQNLELSLTMRNTGESAYSGLSVTLPDGSVGVSDVELAPGKSYEGKIRYTAQEDGEVSVYVAGQDANGETVAVVSNALAVKMQDASQALVLRVRAQAQNSVIYSEPAVLRFGVVVDNIGETDATTLTVKQGSTTVATIPSLPSGESRTLVFDVQTSIAGQFQFIVSGKDGSGNDRSYESNIIQVNYIEPTPVPTNTPGPTQVPPTPSPEPTATPAPSLGERVQAGVDAFAQRIRESVNPIVLYVIAAVLAAVLTVALTVSTVTSVRRRKLLANAIDTIERSPDVRDHKGRRKGKKKKEKKTAKPAESIVPTPELTDEPEESFNSAGDAADDWDAADDGAQEDTAQQPVSRSRARRAAQEAEVSAEETLRVVPVDERPEFVAQGKVDDSETRVFSKVKDQLDGDTRVQKPVRESEQAQEVPAQRTATRRTAAQAVTDETRVQPRVQAADPVANDSEGIRSAANGETIRLNNAEMAELVKKQERKSAGNTIKSAKPMKKKKKGFFFSRDDEDDLLEDLEGERPTDDDDDLFE